VLTLRHVAATIRDRPLVRSGEWERLRSRGLAFAGLWLFLGGLVAALGFGALVLRATLALLVVGSVGGVVVALSQKRALRLYRQALGGIARADRRLRALVEGLELPRRLRRLASQAGPSSRRALSRLAAWDAGARRIGIAAARVAFRYARSAFGYARVGSAHASRVSARAAREGGTYAGRALRTGADALSERAARASAPPDPLSRAIQLNTHGAQLRREGKHERAAEEHRAALAIVRELGDERTEALTLNNLALALVHTEGIAAAVEHFEQALVVLRQLGDDEHEGRVIANLGFVHKSHGSSEEADDLLHAALDKLPADSTAYRRVEEQLRHAS
jgi:tetratricopeptide (TPR) repeat protein